MEDLAGLNFSASTPKSAPPNQTRFPHNTAYISPVPSRGLSGTYNGVLPPTSNGKPASAQRNPSAAKPDSFATLSSFSGIRRSGQQSNASLEQQRLAKEKEKRQVQEEEKQKMDMHFGANEFWEKHSRQGTPTITTTNAYFPLGIH
jgi:hypothetical protein